MATDSRKYVAIDPSVNSVGFATMQNDEWDWGVLYPPKGEHKDVGRVSHWLAEQVYKLYADVLVLEYPTFMNAERGLIAAQKGYTVDLAYVCGWIAGFSGLDSDDVYLYTPNQWKGQKKKHMVQFRFLRLFGDKYRNVSDHAFEATMMLHWHLTKHGII